MEGMVCCVACDSQGAAGKSTHRKCLRCGTVSSKAGYDGSSATRRASDCNDRICEANSDELREQYPPKSDCTERLKGERDRALAELESSLRAGSAAVVEDASPPVEFEVLVSPDNTKFFQMNELARAASKYAFSSTNSSITATEHDRQLVEYQAKRFTGGLGYVGHIAPKFASDYGASPLVKRALSLLNALPLDADTFGTLRDGIAKARAEKTRLEEQHDKMQTEMKRKYEAGEDERNLKCAEEEEKRREISVKASADRSREANEGPVLLADGPPDPRYVDAYYATLAERKQNETADEAAGGGERE